jgi:glycosyltransferase involved in cell wall biosynthesis
MLISTPFPPTEGIGYHVFNLSRHLIERGHEVTVLTRGQLRTETDEYAGIRIVRAPFLPVYPFHIRLHGFFLNRIFRTLEKEFDILHVHIPLPPVLSTSLPVVCTMHGSIVGNAAGIEVRDLRGVCNRLLTRTTSIPTIADHLEHASVITAVSGSVAEQVRTYFSCETCPVVGNGVNQRIFRAEGNPAKTDSDRYILYAGRLSHGKGLFDLLEAAGPILRQHDVKILIAGDGVLGARLDRLIRDRGLAGRVMLLGQVSRDDLIRLYQNATIFILPSYYEGLPTVLLEAMACGVPVIGTAVSGCVDVITDRHDGRLIPPGSPESIARTVTELLDDDGMRRSLGRNARQTIENRFTWDTIADTVEQWYLRFAGGDRNESVHPLL